MVDILHEIDTITPLAVGTLASVVADTAAYGSSNMKATFLCKKVEYTYVMQNPDIDSNVGYLVLARGDQTGASIKNALAETNPAGPFDQPGMTQEAYKIFKVIPLNSNGGVGGGTTPGPTGGSGEISFGGKGVPFLEDTGFKWGMFNPTAGSWTTGSFIMIFARYFGAWLDA